MGFEPGAACLPAKPQIPSPVGRAVFGSQRRHGGPGRGGKSKVPPLPATEAERWSRHAGEHALLGGDPALRRLAAATNTAEQKIGVQFAVQPAQRRTPLRSLINNNATRLSGPLRGSRLSRSHAGSDTGRHTALLGHAQGCSATLSPCITRRRAPTDRGLSLCPAAVLASPGLCPQRSHQDKPCCPFLPKHRRSSLAPRVREASWSPISRCLRLHRNPPLFSRGGWGHSGNRDPLCQPPLRG